MANYFYMTSIRRYDAVVSHLLREPIGPFQMSVTHVGNKQSILNSGSHNYHLHTNDI